MKKTVLICALILISLILSTGFSMVHARPAYSSTVFSPNDVSYDFSLRSSVEVYNASTGELLSSHIMEISGMTTLHSKRMQIGFMAWGAIINITYTVEENGTITNQQEIDIPLPPVFAVQENTRKIFLTELILDVLRGEITEINYQDIARRVATNRPVPGFYFYNPFYIETDITLGDSIPYGFWNETSDSGLVIHGIVHSETSVEAAGRTYNVWVVRITEAEILGELELIVGEELELPGDITFILDLYYEKSSGWLVGGDLSGSLESTEENNVEIHISQTGELTLTSMGTILIAGESYLDRLLGLPPYATLVLDFLLIAAIIIYMIKRR